MAKTLASVRRARPFLGTLVEITAWRGKACRLEQAVECAFGAVERIHRLMSYHEPGSDVSRLNRAGKVPVVVHVKLTRFRGHRRICVEGVHDAKQGKEASTIPA